jgi:hypothetical protein
MNICLYAYTLQALAGQKCLKSSYSIIKRLVLSKNGKKTANLPGKDRQKSRYKLHNLLITNTF